MFEWVRVDIKGDIVYKGQTGKSWGWFGDHWVLLIFLGMHEKKLAGSWLKFQCQNNAFSVPPPTLVWAVRRMKKAATNSRFLYDPFSAVEVTTRQTIVHLQRHFVTIQLITQVKIEKPKALRFFFFFKNTILWGKNHKMVNYLKKKIRVQLTSGVFQWFC